MSKKEGEQFLMMRFEDQCFPCRGSGENPTGSRFHLFEEVFAAEVDRSQLLACDKDRNRDSDMPYWEQIKNDMNNRFRSLIPKSIATCITSDLPIPQSIKGCFERDLKLLFRDLAPKLELGVTYHADICGWKVLIKGIKGSPYRVKVYDCLFDGNSLVNHNHIVRSEFTKAISMKRRRNKNISNHR